jgi:spore coat protein U-like protein
MVWAASDENCDLKFDNLDTKIDWQGGTGAYAGKYNPFDPLSYVQAISFDVVNNKTTGCSYFVDAEQSEKSGTYNRELEEHGHRLQYNIYIDPALTQVWMGAETSAASVIQGTIEPAESKKESRATETYYFIIDPLQLANDHKNYKDKVKFGLWRETFDNPDRHRDDDEKVEFKAEVPKVVDVSLVDPNSEFVTGQLNRFVNFGMLVSEDSESFDLIVRYNKKYELTFESRNEGLMVNSVSPEDTVVYEFLVDDQIYDLGGGKPEKIKDQDNPGFEGDRHHITVRIADTIADKAEGVYTDSITGIIKAK